VVAAARVGDPGPFFHAGDERGVLCVHGFTSTAFEMSYVGRHLADLGMTVSGILLPGHGGTAADLDATGWREWSTAVERAFDELRARCRRVAVVGQSLGGLLSLHLAAGRGREIAALASMGAPLWLPWPASIAVQLLGRRGMPAVPKRGGPDLRDREMAARMPTLPVFPPVATRSLYDFTRVVRAQIDRVNVPLFIAHARRDHVAPPACAAELARRVASRDVTLLWLEQSFHILPLDVEKDHLCAELGRFLVERMRT
jgi:carboxylesterase